MVSEDPQKPDEIKEEAAVQKPAAFSLKARLKEKLFSTKSLMYGAVIFGLLFIIVIIVLLDQGGMFPKET